ncbi:MAG TPA: hypothetical protein VNM92_04125 [Thermoanaerobaculia bacterium]|nr:hypothetical protein [Thermoanaerobaculia bacterium]
MPHTNASHIIPKPTITRYIFILACLLLPAFATLDAQPMGREPVLLVIDADAPVKPEITKALLKQFAELPGMELKVLEAGKEMSQHHWALTVVVNELTKKDGAKNGRFVMAAAFTNLLATFEPIDALKAFEKSKCIPEAELSAFIASKPSAVSDLKSILLWGGEMREGFTQPTAELASIFEKEFLPEIRRQRLKLWQNGRVQY